MHGSMPYCHLKQLELVPYSGNWFLIASVVAVLVGSASAFFLISLDPATVWRESHPRAIGLGPGVGLVRAFMQEHAEVLNKMPAVLFLCERLLSHTRTAHGHAARSC
ncbi:hypothetical protein [Pseudomonas veronii]|uniref:hypothetical protein n=1 Tax=Pseudomonas veronii TaxID=76761 RepID=UPI001CA43225|nr:hypothetical protein [Pseudomonas veronii]